MNLGTKCLARCIFHMYKWSKMSMINLWCFHSKLNNLDISGNFREELTLFSTIVKTDVKLNNEKGLFFFMEGTDSLDSIYPYIFI